jgi:hypothetical protein
VGYISNDAISKTGYNQGYNVGKGETSMTKSIQYFKTFDQAWKATKSISLSACLNEYQNQTDKKEPKVVSFAKGYAVQFGDCGEYMTKEPA